MQIINDRDSDQPSATVDVQVEFSPGQFSPAERMVKVQGAVRGVSDGQEVLRVVVPNFLTKLMTQTSWVPRRQNKITIFLQTNIELVYQDEITITGFNPCATAGGNLQLTEPVIQNAYLFGNQIAYDDGGRGVLLLTITTPSVKFPSNTLIELGFYVTNLNHGRKVGGCMHVIKGTRRARGCETNPLLQALLHPCPVAQPCVPCSTRPSAAWCHACSPVSSLPKG